LVRDWWDERRRSASERLPDPDPENVTGVAGVLGHSSLETSEKYYNRANMVDANNRYQQTLRALRRGRGAPACAD